MLPILFKITIFMTLSILIRKTSKSKRAIWIARGFAFSAALCVVFSAFVMWATPKISLPLPSGKFKIALSHMVLKTDRPEPYTLNPTDTRKLHIKIWYPTADISGTEFTYYKPVPKHAAYASPSMSDVHAKTISSYGPLSMLRPRLKTRLAQARLSAYAGSAPLQTTEKFPILFFSPGHRAHLDYFSTTMQDIASHGYIVVGINHSYEPPVSILPTGETYMRTDTALENAPALSTHDYVKYEERLQHNYGIIEQYTSNKQYTEHEERFFSAYSTIINTPQDLTQDLPIRVADMLSAFSFLETNIEKQNPSALFSIMDISKIGTFGMSFGGPTSAEFCRIYKKCLAIANIDGKNWGNMLKEPLDVPMLWIAGSYTDNERFDIPYALNHWRADAFRVFIPGVTHQAFTDAPFLSPVLNLALIDMRYILKPGHHNAQVHKITNGALVQLFDHYIKGQPFNLTQLENELAQVRVEEYHKK
ncbi:MAG: hypothetical protein COA43_14440 [Robiginitomaculum sp.]|nr:MAG: hypothetical protein COA43_14440 [Robiginitomaculum sp.]